MYRYVVEVKIHSAFDSFIGIVKRKVRIAPPLASAAVDESPWSMIMQLEFCGAAQEVTGSNHVLKVNGKTIVLDFGMIQGGKEHHERNRQAPPYECAKVDAVLLSHAHIDHSGRLPVLTQRGFRGPIFTTSVSAEITRLLLLDSAHIQEEDVKFKRKRLVKENRPHDWLAPLYTTAQAEELLQLLRGVPYDDEFEVVSGVHARFRDAGHMLGSASVEIRFEEDNQQKTVVFSGDIGRPNTPILRDSARVSATDYLIVESTYGDRIHPDGDKQGILRDVIAQAIARKGKVLIPAFAIGRTQQLIYELNQLFESRQLPAVPVYVDSPMAKQATAIAVRHTELYDAEARGLLQHGDRPLEFRDLHIVASVDESKAINRSADPCIIIAASGMCNAGRIKHHLKHNLANERNTVLFVGYQAVGTLGRLIKEGMPQVRIFGELVPVRAHVESIEGYSAHADREELLKWLRGFQEPPKRTFVVHGEKPVALGFARTIEAQLGWAAVAPRLGEIFEL